MATKSYSFPVDLKNPSGIAPINIVQGDTDSNIFNISLTVDNGPVDLTDSTIAIVMAKADGTSVVDVCTIVDALKGLITYTVASQGYAVLGTVLCSIEITKGLSRTTSQQFKFKVVTSLNDEDLITSQTDYPILTQLINDVQGGSVVYKPMVTTYANIATTYPNPENGWTVQTSDTRTKYRWNGTSWVPMGSYQDDHIGDMGQITETNLVAAIKNDRTELASHTSELESHASQLADKANQTDLNTINTNISNLDNQKLDKTGLIYMANLAQDVKTSMTGGSVAVVGTDGVIETNLATSAIEYFRHYKTEQYPMLLKDKPKNLFNKKTITAGYYVVYSTGALAANSSYFASDYIPVYPGQVLIGNAINQLAFYNASKTYVSGLDTTASASSFTVPTGAYFLRLCAANSTLQTLQLEEGIVSTTYESHYTSLLYDLSKYFTLESLLTMLKGNIFEAEYISPNLFNKGTVTNGKYANYNTGALTDNASYSVSDYIVVKASTKYIKSNDIQLAFYDSNKTFISGLGTGTSTFTTPSGAYYVRISCLTTDLNIFQMVEGDSLPEYTAYGTKYIDNSQLNPNIRITKNIKSIMSKIILSTTTKKIKLIGDSITQGVTGTGFAQDGALIMTVGATTWNVNTSGHCWANSLKAYFESKFNCQVLNYGCTGANSNTLISGLSQLIDGTEDIVICMIGTNDRSNSTKQQFYNNLISIYNYCNNLGINVIFMSSIPSSVTWEQGETNHMEDIDHIIMKASTDLGLEYISVYKLFIDYCKNLGVTIDSLLTEGLHPNDAGYDVMFYLISNALGFGVKRDGATW